MLCNSKNSKHINGEIVVKVTRVTYVRALRYAGTYVKQESPAVADKPARRESMHVKLSYRIVSYRKNCSNSTCLQRCR